MQPAHRMEYRMGWPIFVATRAVALAFGAYGFSRPMNTLQDRIREAFDRTRGSHTSGPSAESAVLREVEQWMNEAVRRPLGPITWTPPLAPMPDCFAAFVDRPAMDGHEPRLRRTSAMILFLLYLDGGAMLAPLLSFTLWT